MSIQVVTPQQGYATARRFPRYKVDVPVRVITQGLTKVTIVQGRGSELNIGGMAVFAGMELSIGAQVIVEFTPPYSGQPIRVRCFVRNRAGYRYGVEFITESDDDYENVNRIETILRSMGSPAE
jgi:PilZ domain-containing protein